MIEFFDIKVAKEAEEIGLAAMLKDLLSQNLAQNPQKVQDFRKLCLRIGLRITDAEIDLTMDFQGGTLTIHPGIQSRPQLLIMSEADMVMTLSNVSIRWGLPYYFDQPGKEVLEAIRSGRIRIKGMIRHFVSLVRFSRVMSVR